MKTALNITNGDSAVTIMQEANIPGDFLAWRDVLHDGPVPQGVSLEKLSQIRAHYIADCGWGDRQQIEAHFTARDTQLKSSVQYKKILLWFEHDLYDQLQILQILDWFYQHPNSNAASLSMICTDNYLGMLTPEEMSRMVQHEKPVTKQQLDLAHLFWEAFRADTPKALTLLLHSDTRVLPFLYDAIIRQLQEYPSTINGLSRTAQQALSIINNNEKRLGHIFAKNQKLENRVFMGDASFWAILNEFLASTPPLLKSSNGEKRVTLPIEAHIELTITDVGKEVLSGNQNWLSISPINKWIGGVHLTLEKIWCWNPEKQSMIAS